MSYSRRTVYTMRLTYCKKCYTFYSHMNGGTIINILVPSTKPSVGPFKFDPELMVLQTRPRDKLSSKLKQPSIQSIETFFKNAYFSTAYLIQSSKLFC